MTATGGGPGSAPAGAGGRTQKAREQAATFGQETAQTGGQVARNAAGQGREVLAEAGHQTRNLLGEASSQLRQQAQAQQKQVAQRLREIGMGLQHMAERDGQTGMTGDVVRRASSAAQDAAGWLEARDPGMMINDVREYARRRPGAFLAGAVVAGLVFGRLTRALTSAGQQGRAPSGDGYRRGERDWRGIRGDGSGSEGPGAAW